MVLVSVVFLAVYATLTWFTAASGIDKIFTLFGKEKDLFSLALSAISTTTTMVVNTFSQVSKVFDPKTYTDIREKVLPIWNETPDSPSQTRLERAWNTTKTVVKCAMIIGDLTTYSVAGGVGSGESVGGTLGDALGWVGAKILFMILSPIILSAVAIAFTYPSLFEKKKPKDLKEIISEPLAPNISKVSPPASQPKDAVVAPSVILNHVSPTPTPPGPSHPHPGNLICRKPSMSEVFSETLIGKRGRSISGPSQNPDLQRQGMTNLFQ